MSVPKAKKKPLTQEEYDAAVPYAMPTAPMARKSLRLSGGSLTFNHDREARTLERFLGSDQMVELTVYGTSGRRGRLARRLRDHVPRRRPPYRLRRVG
ncbi:MAG TPA: hypothetical protein VJ927_09725 [Actinomycetota bacterium]|nr:hypothetical protein [Actinomycetota bacterium]